MEKQENTKGINKIINKDKPYDFMGNNIAFRAIVEGLVVDVVSRQEKWFSFGKPMVDTQVNILNIKNEKGKTLKSFILDVMPNETSSVVSCMFKYLLKNFLCYIESPTVVKDYNTYGYRSSFNKFLVTSNLGVVAEWLGITLEEATATYGSCLDTTGYESDSLFPYVKLYETKYHERKITRPRKPLDLDTAGTRVTPLFALKTGLDILYDKLSKDTYDVEFCKDSGQKRVINTTFNIDKIKSVYEDSSFVANAVDSWYDGDFISNPTLERGYIRVLEMGASVYDNPLRSINYARILSFKKAEPNLAYIFIDLDSVVSTFNDCIYQLKPDDIQEVVESLDIFEVGTTRNVGKNRVNSIETLELWANSQVTLLSTVFLRQLSLFMMGNPQWFNGYTGKPKSESKVNTEETSQPASIEELDFELDFG